MDDVLLGVAGPGGCESVAFRCRCIGGHGPDDAHSCDCGGSWRGEGDTETFEVVSYPVVDLPDYLSAVLATGGGVKRGGIRWPLEVDGG